MNRRAEILAKLVTFDEPSASASLIAELGRMGREWFGAPLVVLTPPDHFLKIMGRFLSGRLSAEQVEEWAGNLEGREDVGFPPKNEELLNEVLFCLATPSINHGIDSESIGELMLRLQRGR